MDDNDFEIKSKLEKKLCCSTDLQEVWDSTEVRKILAESTANWLYSLRSWSIFITLTFREEKPPDVAKALFMRLIRKLNEDVFGKHYTKKVGHSYFSYLLAIEYQRREVIHFHVLIDRPVNFDKIHILWNSWAGFAWTEIIKNQIKIVNYACKYISKGGEVMPFIAKEQFTPEILPYWWKLPSIEIKGKMDDCIND
jgi:hypothetical protein